MTEPSPLARRLWTPHPRVTRMGPCSIRPRVALATRFEHARDAGGCGPGGRGRRGGGGGYPEATPTTCPAWGSPFSGSGAPGRLEDLDRAIIVAHEAVGHPEEPQPCQLPVQPGDRPVYPVQAHREGGGPGPGHRSPLRMRCRPHPGSHPNRATYLSSLGLALDRRFDRTAMLEDLDQAIALAQEAVQATPQVRRTGPDS